MNGEDFSKEPYKAQTFDTYILWKSLPTFLKGQPKVSLEKFGIDEEIIFNLLEIKTQADFGKRYNVDGGTLTDWNKRIQKDGLSKNINSWARKLTPNVVFALYKNITKNGRAHEVRAWYELIEHD
ncbi:MAG TPA: hypothetical protein PKA60_00595 [Candidatus Paceibacterota bacterium]|nr:hypothetical protein [Candidatus Paceibacterota bacterium]